MGVRCGAPMPIPGFSIGPPPEIITGAEAVEMVMARFESSGPTEAEACGWLIKQVRDGKLKLSWAETNPEYLNGLYLRGEGFIYIPGLPEAQAIDELDWLAGELRRQITYPKIVDRWGGGDPSKLTQAELPAHDKELRARCERDAPTA